VRLKHTHATPATPATHATHSHRSSDASGKKRVMMQQLQGVQWRIYSKLQTRQGTPKNYQKLSTTINNYQQLLATNMPYKIVKCKGHKVYRRFSVSQLKS
jgi:CCR4-NOT transcriptional regulation complex NOT5 subunit